MNVTRRWLVLTMVALLAAGAAPAQDTNPAARPRNIILMGWDGAHRDHVKALLAEGKLPNLKKLIAEGAMINIDVTSGATDTKAGWSQILTGYKPQITGVYSNGRYRDVPAGYSVFERLKARFGTNTFAAVAVIAKRANCGEIDPPTRAPLDAATDGGDAAAEARKDRRIVEEDGRQFLVFDGSPYYTMHKACDEWVFGLEEDGKVGDKTLELLEKYQDKPFFFFVHLAEVDKKGHRFGEPSAEYNEAIVSGDTQLGRLAERLKALKLYDSTRVYVVADPGFDVGAKNHLNAPYVFLATNDKAVTRAGTRADVAPTILDRFGVDLTKLDPPLSGETLTRASSRPESELKAPAKPPKGGIFGNRGKAKGRAGRGRPETAEPEAPAVEPAAAR